VVELENRKIHNLFYTPPEKITNREIIIEGEDTHHLKDVLRKGSKNVIYIVDGCGNCYKVRISKIISSIIRADILEKEYIKKKNIVDIELAFVPLKGLKNDFIIEKGTELGLRRFFPFISKYSVLPDLSQNKIERFKRIAISAMLQSQQYYCPEIIFQNDLDKFLEKFKEFDVVLLSDRNGSLEIPVGAKSILYIVGPEGGFDESEIELLKEKGARLISLGPNRLRSETAAITGLIKILTVYKAI